MRTLKNIGSYVRTACGKSVVDEALLATAAVFGILWWIFGGSFPEVVAAVLSAIATFIGYAVLVLAPIALVAWVVVRQRKQSGSFKAEVAFIAKRRDNRDALAADLAEVERNADRAEDEATEVNKLVRSARLAHLQAKALGADNVTDLFDARQQAVADAQRASKVADDLREETFRLIDALDTAKALVKTARADYRASVVDFDDTDGNGEVNRLVAV